VLNTCKSNGRIEKLASLEVSGGRVSNAWVTCPKVGDNTSKGVLIPHNISESHGLLIKGVIRLRMDPRLIS
jgi:hypothetical protein